MTPASLAWSKSLAGICAVLPSHFPLLQGYRLDLPQNQPVGPTIPSAPLQTALYGHASAAQVAPPGAHAVKAASASLPTAFASRSARQAARTSTPSTFQQRAMRPLRFASLTYIGWRRQTNSSNTTAIPNYIEDFLKQGK
ncbi:hypothetical protein C8R44DRAFT_880515 [Mycena epipterygia]|nr:hypothetical protein C8R44DRAFT_880515 [Mycena epipterygia]